MHPTKEDLAEARRALLARQLQKAGMKKTGGPQIVRRPAGEPAPLSFAQQRLWFLFEWDSGSPVYNLAMPLRLHGRLDLAALQAALDETLRRHEALRTTFVSMAGQMVQRIAPLQPVPLAVVELQHLPADEREAQALELATAEMYRPFDLTQGPVWRNTLLRLGEQDHILLPVMHHAVSDGWSISILVRELATLYRSFSAGRPSPLAELPIQYADFAVWQRQWLRGEVLERQLSYWKKQLDGCPPMLELPTDRPRPAMMTYNGDNFWFDVPPRLVQGLKALSQRKGVTLFMTLLAAFQVLLSRYSGQEDIAVGTPIANRNWVEIEGLIGCFVNTLVLRGDLSGNPTFCELLERVREVTLEAYAHQDLPFEKLVEELRPERDLSRSPLFQVMLILQNTPAQPEEFSGLTLFPIRPAGRVARFDITLSLEETKEGELHGLVEYNTDLFEPETIGRMIAHLETLLGGIVAAPEQPISALPLLTTAEWQQIVVDWNATQSDYPHDRCLQELFEARVEQNPAAVAVVDGVQQLTYGELNRRANQLAHYLRRLGVGPEARVGLYMDRSVEMVVGLLGILKAGGAYVPLDLSYPRERLAFMLADSQAQVLLTQQHLLEQIPEHRPRTLCLDQEGASLAGASPKNPPNLSSSANLAYIIYTSGSTGLPKGVQVSQQALVNFLTGMRRRPGLAAQDTWLAVTTPAFDIAGLEIWLPLLVGARLVLADRATTSLGAELAQLLAQSGATVMQATPATWRLLLDAGWAGQPGLKVLCGGETLPRDLADRLLSRGVEPWNMYGPTETTIWSTADQVKGATGSVPIGRPIANTRVYLLDKQLNPVPVGVTGELYIGGDGVARGYCNRPGLTAERFLPDPLVEPGARLYRTGDLARYRPDGAIEFLGRADLQVKLRGHRIELGEIEVVLAAHPDVREAVVSLREDVPGDKRLVAYVVPRPDRAPSGAELRAFLREKLPEYMVPAALVALEALPRTPSGKVNRRALPAPDPAILGTEKGFVAPGTAIEEILAETWMEVLQLKQVGVHDSFFAIGGHSLLATQVVSRVRDRFEIDLPVRTLFEAPTIAELAVQVEQVLVDKIAALDENDVQHLLRES